jgi:hypothetical protein
VFDGDMDRHELEMLRRSAAMAPLSPTDVERLLHDFAVLDEQLRRLQDGLRHLLDEAGAP